MGVPLVAANSEHSGARLVRRPVILVSLIALATPAVLLGLETAASASTAIASVVIAGTEASPVITVNGSGFGADPSALGTAEPDACGPYSGDDYADNFNFSDDTNTWTAGQGPGDCIGVLFSSYSNTQIVFTLGSFYGGSFNLGTGDAFTMNVLGATLSGDVPSVVPASNPPVSAAITPGQTATWALSITNPYDAPLTSVTATLDANADGSPLDFADANMPGCTFDSETEQENCTLPDIPAHTSRAFQAFVATDAMSVGTTISGDFNLFSPDLLGGSGASGTLDTVTIVSCGTACVQGVATPGSPVASSPGPPTAADPTKQIVTLPANNPAAPPVAVTLESINPGPKTSKADQQLCPTSGIKCSGQISVIAGNFTKYVSKSHPIKIQIVMKWNTAIPPGHMEMSKPVGPPVQLATCVVKHGLYNTPCARPETRSGTAAAHDLTTTDTVFFIGTDPHVARRASNVPDAPTGVKAVAGKKSATVTWKTPVVTNGPITGYLITPHLGRVAELLVNVAGAGTKHTVTGLTTGKTYTFTVEAKNRHGISFPSIPSKAIKPK